MKFKLLLDEVDKTSKALEPLMLKYASTDFKDDLYKKVIYTFSDVGVRIRPFLLRMGYEASGSGGFEEILPVAAAIELMQISTLVIDDILDEAEMRNGRETVAKKWGKENALLIGNMLYCLSERALHDGLFTDNIDSKRAKEAEEKFRDTYKEIHVGQYLDLTYEHRATITELEYLDMIKRTTALFIQAPIKIGAILSDAPPEVVNSLSLYGLTLGYAYQIRDDVIDIIGEEKYTGKPFAGDIKRGKKRLPIIHAFSNGSESVQRRLKTLVKKELMSDEDVKEIVEILYNCGSIEYSTNKTKEFCNQAINEILRLENSKVESLLTDLAELVAAFDT